MNPHPAHPVPLVPMWEHQREGVEFLKAGGVMLAWEPGAGKTLPAAVFAAERLHTHGRALVLCLPAVRLQLVEELHRFFGFEIHVQLIPKGLKGKTPRIHPDADFVVCAFTQASEVYVFNALKNPPGGRRWGTIIVDEAHACKNPDATRTRMLYGARPGTKAGLYNAADRTVLLTGTPITKDPMDLYTHYSRLFPRALTLTVGDQDRPLTKADWEADFCVLEQGAFGARIVGSKNLDKLRGALKPFVDRRRLTDVVKSMPPLVVDAWPIEAGDIDLRSLAPEHREEVERAIVRLQTQRTDPEFLMAMQEPDPALGTLRRLYSQAKATVAAGIIADWLDENPDQKALVFGLHPLGLSTVVEKCFSLGAQLISGIVPPARREAAMARFKTDPTARLLALQTTVGGTGLNLQVASRVFILDAAWTPASNEQAIARAYRAGQTRPVHVTYFSLAGSVDERVARVLRDRTRMIETILDH